MKLSSIDHRHAAFLVALTAGCATSSTDDPLGAGGSNGGNNNTASGGATGGDSTGAGGSTSSGSGGSANGGNGTQAGMSSMGGAASGGARNNGGMSSAGRMSGGGAQGGGKSAGGSSNSGGNATAGATSNNGGKSNTGGAASGGASSAGASAAGSSNGGAPAGATELCARWKSDRMNLMEEAWNGNAASCTAGDMNAASRDTALRLVNLYRYIAGLPAVTTDPARNQQDQACALMMQANNTINHSPPTTWTCYTADGAKAAGSSNLAGSGAITAVDSYMLDPGNATTIGHRRWILSNSLGPIGIGSTGKYSCMWTLSGTGKASKPWMSWPSPGVFPLQAFATSRQSIDTTGWSLQSDSINLAGAQVTVTFNGTDQPVTVTQLDANYGSRYAIRFNPMGWTSAVGTYHVSVTGIATPIEYDINVVSCN